MLASVWIFREYTYLTALGTHIPSICFCIYQVSEDRKCMWIKKCWFNVCCYQGVTFSIIYLLHRERCMFSGYFARMPQKFSENIFSAEIA